MLLAHAPLSCFTGCDAPPLGVERQRVEKKIPIHNLILEASLRVLHSTIQSLDPASQPLQDLLLEPLFLAPKCRRMPLVLRRDCVDPPLHTPTCFEISNQNPPAHSFDMKIPIRMALQPLFRHQTILIGNFQSELLSSCFCIKISNQNGSAATVAPPNHFDGKFPIRILVVLFLY